GMEISDRLAGVLSVELVTLSRKMLEEKTGSAERWHQLREVLRELSQLRRDDHRAVRTAIKRARWERQVEREDAEYDKQFDEETRKKRCAPFQALLELPAMAKLFGDGDAGRDLAAFLLEQKYDLPLGRLGQKRNHESVPTPAQPARREEATVPPGPTESN